MANFAPGDKDHLYVHGYELYDAVIDAVNGTKCTVSYGPRASCTGDTAKSGQLVDVDLHKMYLTHPKIAPVMTGHADLKTQFGEDAQVRSPLALLHHILSLIGYPQEFVIAEFDAEFPEEGYDEMIEMKRLNDCELARSLEIKFFRFCYGFGYNIDVASRCYISILYASTS